MDGKGAIMQSDEEQIRMLVATWMATTHLGQHMNAPRVSVYRTYKL